MSESLTGHRIRAVDVQIRVRATDGTLYTLVAPAPDAQSPEAFEVALFLDSRQQVDFGLCAMPVAREYVIALVAPYMLRWHLRVEGDNITGEVTQ